jgi:dUTPase
MNLKILKNGFENNLKLPAKKGDVGYDLVAASMNIVGVKTEASQKKADLESYWHDIYYIEYDTGVTLEPFSYVVDYTKGEIEECMDITKYVQVAPRSSLSNYNLVLANHVAAIDANFRGTIKCRFKYIFSPNDLVSTGSGLVGKINEKRIYNIGAKIAQAIFSNTIHPNIIYANNLSDSDRKGGEFGSTGI